jgi:hypothetical protein
VKPSELESFADKKDVEFDLIGENK